MEGFAKRGKQGFIVICGLILALAIIVGVLGMHVYRLYKLLSTGMVDYRIQDFDSVKDAYTLLAEKLGGWFDEEYDRNDALQSISVSQSAGYWILECRENQNEDGLYTIKYSASQEETDAYKAVSGTFAKSNAYGFAGIKVLSDRVVFQSYSPYSIIYMENGRKPKYVITGDEKRPLLYADRLCSGWYQVMVKYDESESESTGENQAADHQNCSGLLL